jgi:hypothetical protein
METLLIVWRFLLLGGSLVFPQLLGVLLYFKLSRVPRWVAAIAAALAPAIFFFWFTRMLMIAQLREAYAHGERCGMPAVAAGILLLAGTAMQLFGGILTQIILSVRRRRKVKSFVTQSN